MTAPYQVDQQPIYQIEYWDTPFSPLYNDVASVGMRMDVYDLPAGFGEGFSAMSLAGWDAALTGYEVLPNGRLANCLGYWAGGAPGYHGASTNRRVAYRIQGTVRSAADRAWWSNLAAAPMKFGVAGSGQMRITVNGSEVLNTSLEEPAYLTNGPAYSDPVNLTSGDTVVVYFVQDQESWGGFVVKAVLPDDDGLYTQAAYQEAPVLGCGLVSYGTPTVTLLTEIMSVETDQQPNQARKAEFRVPLITVSTYDGVGWEWERTDDETGHLRLHRILQSAVDVRRQRLIRISMGFKDMGTGSTSLTPVFTGFTDDFEVDNGVATVTCYGFEQRLADQYVKNYPDRISYMAFGYQQVSGTLEPVYNITAYDNWPMEHVFRDLALRGGLDESRFRATVTVRQADGTFIPAVM